MRYQQPSMEGTLFAMRNAEGGRGMVRDILIGQAANSVGNMLLDAFEPEQRKRDEEKDLGDRFRDFTRTALNIGTGANYAYQMARGYGLFDKQPKGAEIELAKNYRRQEKSQGPEIELAKNYRRQEKSPADIDFEVDYGDAANRSQPLTMTERTRQGEELVKKARAERMPGLVVTDLSARVDDDMMNRLRGLEREAASYPKKREEPSDYEKGLAAGMEAMAMRNLQSQAPSQTVDVTFTEPERRSTAYVAPERSSNPLLSREPMGFNETYGVKGGVPMARDTRKREDAESLANFYANLPTNPETGERDLGNFASKYLVSKGAIEPDTVMVVDPEVDQPRNSGGLLQGQLRGETLYNQQENREPFVQDQQIDAIYSGDEQGPGFSSGSIADMFKQQAQAIAQSDARLYRNVGERISNMKQILSEAEGGGVEPETQKLSGQLRGQLGSLGESLGKLTRTVDDKLQREENSLIQRQQDLQAQQAELDNEMSEVMGAPSSRRQDAAQQQMQNFMAQMLDDNAASNERIQKQVASRETPSFAPTPDMVPNYVMPERRTAEPKAATVAPSMTISEEPTVKKTTIIEETVPATQQRMSPLEASEKLRRIQTSGRPNSRQEAQDFLQSIKGQMING